MEKIVNYWTEICKLLPKHRKKVIAHSNILVCNEGGVAMKQQFQKKWHEKSVWAYY